MTKKQKDGLERSEYKSFAEIKSALKGDFDKALGVVAPESGVAHSTSASSNSQASEACMKDMEDMSDPKYLAREAGYEIGKLHIEKDVSKNVCKLVEMKEVDVVFDEQILAPRHPLVRNVSYDLLKKTFNVFKGKLQCAITDDISKYCAHAHTSMQKDAVKATVFAALTEGASTWSSFELEHVQFYLYPSEVRCKKPCKKGELKFFPATELNKLVLTSGSSPYFVTKEGVASKAVVYLDPPHRVKSETGTDWKNNVHFSAFWWVAKTHDSSEVNMKQIKFEVKGYVFPAFENTKALKAFDSLVVLDQTGAAKKARV